jgi:hypothetical protein
MLAAAFAAIAPPKVIFFRKHDKAFLAEVKLILC